MPLMNDENSPNNPWARTRARVAAFQQQMLEEQGRAMPVNPEAAAQADPNVPTLAQVQAQRAALGPMPEPSPFPSPEPSPTTAPLALPSVPGYDQGTAQALAAHAAAAVAPDQGVMAKNSGKTSQAKVTSNLDKKGVLNQTLFMDPTQFQAAIDNITKTDAYKQQSQGIDDMRELMKIGMNRTPQMDLTPLNDLANNWSRDGWKTNYKAPDNMPAAPTQLLQKYMDKLQDDRRDLFKSTVSAIGAQKAGSNLSSYDLKQLIESMNKSQDPNMGKGAGKVYDPGKDLKDHQKRMEALEGMRSVYDRLNAMTNGFTNGKGTGIFSRYAPLSWQSGDAAEIQSAYKDLQNQIIYATSGKQINEAEARRLKQALGDSALSGPREFAIAMQRYGVTLKDIMKQKEGAIKGLHPEVLQMYKNGGGTLSEDFTPPAKKAPGGAGKSPNPAPNGGGEKSKEDLLKMSPAEFDAYEASVLKGGQ